MDGSGKPIVRSNWQSVWMIAGVLRIDPEPRTLRELWWMIDGWRREQWKHTSLVAWAAFQSQSAKQIPIDRFSPYKTAARNGGIPIRAGNIEALKIFVRK